MNSLPLIEDATIQEYSEEKAGNLLLGAASQSERTLVNLRFINPNLLKFIEFECSQTSDLHELAVAVCKIIDLQLKKDRIRYNLGKNE
ncbi:hypothetical protein IT568_06270 [bacterium]|nr:hypothetical protein [bacterium]